VPGWKDGRRPALAGIGGPMDHTESITPTPAAGILGVVGGALLALGSFLTWAEVSGGGTTVTAKGVDGSDGYITLVAGLVAVVAGIMMARGSRRVLAVLVIIAGIVGGGIGLYDALTAKNSVLDAAAEELAPTLGASAQQVRTVLDQAIDAGQLSVSISIGLFIVIGGGVVALVGGILGLRDAGQPAGPGRTTAPGTSGTRIGGPDAPPAPMPPPTSRPDHDA
jgi:Tryptophan-associated transmembrane protein (Trp_oprn_chp)